MRSANPRAARAALHPGYGRHTRWSDAEQAARRPPLSHQDAIGPHCDPSQEPASAELHTAHRWPPGEAGKCASEVG